MKNKNMVFLMAGVLIVLVLIIVLVISMLGNQQGGYDYTGLPSKIPTASTDETTLPEETTIPESSQGG